MEDNVTSDAVKDHPAGTGRNGKRVIVGVAAAVAVVLALGGVCGYRAWEDHRVSVARGACGSAVAAQKKAVDSYRTLLDADGLYRATEGKVQDDKTRDALKQAIAKRDADAIAKAVKAVNDSKTAKDQADAEATAKAQAEQEAAAQAAAAQQAQQQAQRSYSSGGWSGSTGGRSYSGGSYSGGSQGGYSSNAGSSSSSSASDNIHYDWEDNTGDQYNCQPDKFCPLG